MNTKKMKNERKMMKSRKRKNDEAKEHTHRAAQEPIFPAFLTTHEKRSLFARNRLYQSSSIPRIYALTKYQNISLER